MLVSFIRVPRNFLGIAAAAAALMACVDEPSGPRPTVSQFTAIPPALAAHSRGVEDVFLRFEQTIPGFGGFFTDSDGNVSVYVRDAERRSAAVAAVTSWVQAHTDVFSRANPGRIVVRTGQYGFGELMGWQGQIYNNTVANDEIRMIDADEAHNRVRIIVKSSNGLARVAALATSLGIPQAALMVEVGQFDVTLTSADLRASTYRPVPSGVQMTSSINSQNSDVCTVGMNVNVNGAGDFLTAGHCTRDFTGGAIGQAWHQPNDPFNTIGTIVMNKPWSTVCSGGATYCRETDAAIGTYSSTSPDYKIAESSVIGTGNNSGNTTVGNYWSVAIPQRGGARMVGQTLYKTGRTTGTTTGPILGTCVYVPPDPQFNVSVTCANVAQMDDQPGDSGAPVYYWLSVLNPSWRIPEGIAFGSAVSNGMVTALYNTWDQLEADLGVTMNPTHP